MDTAKLSRMDRFPLGLTHTVVNSKKEKEVHPSRFTVRTHTLRAIAF